MPGPPGCQDLWNDGPAETLLLSAMDLLLLKALLRCLAVAVNTFTLPPRFFNAETRLVDPCKGQESCSMHGSNFLNSGSCFLLGVSLLVWITFL